MAYETHAHFGVGQGLAGAAQDQEPTSLKAAAAPSPARRPASLFAGFTPCAAGRSPAISCSKSVVASCYFLGAEPSFKEAL